MRPGFAADGAADRRDHRVHRAQSHAAIRGGWRADGDEGDVGPVHRVDHVVRRGQSALPDRVGDQRVDQFLDDRRAAGGEHRELLGRHIDADDLVAEFGEAAARHHADIADPKH